MLQTPRWLFLRQLLPALDRLIIAFERISKKANTGVQISKNYIKGISLQKLPRNLLYGAFIVFLGYFLTFSVMWRLDNPGVRVIPIMTGSMQPTISRGSLIITSPFENYHIGDIITYRETHPRTGELTDRTLTHRIIATKDTDKGPVYIAQGDANRLPDINDIKQEHIYGKLLYSIPLAGYLYSFVSTLTGFLILIAIPAFLLVKNEIKYIRYNKIMDRIRSEGGGDIKGVVLRK